MFAPVFIFLLCQDNGNICSAPDWPISAFLEVLPRLKAHVWGCPLCHGSGPLLQDLVQEIGCIGPVCAKDQLRHTARS